MSRSLVALLVLVACGRAIPDAPQPIAWNREPCTHCHMLIGDPRYAAEVVTADGEAHAFDDAGCALRYLAAHADAPHAWFRDASSTSTADDRWIALADVAFTTGATTPMGSGLAAVRRGTPGALDVAAATARAGGDR